MDSEHLTADNERFAAVILAAGSSSRFLQHSSPRMSSLKKEFHKLNNDDDLTVLGSAVKAFASIPSVNIIVIAVPENEEEAGRSSLPPGLFELKDKKIIFVNGGKTRSASVFNALSAIIPYNPCYVLIHDGARPWISAQLINSIITAVKKHGAVIPLLPITDTPKEITDNSGRSTGNNEQLTVSGGQSVFFIKRHLKRKNIGAAQTPQAFRFPEILHAHEKAAMTADEEFTDDAEIWSRFCASGGEVAVIPGEKENRKITFPEDIN